MQSLRDKLLKAGLVTEDQAKKAEVKSAPAAGPAEAPKKPSGGSYIVARPQTRPIEAPIPKLPPLPGSKAHQRLESKRQLETDKQLREWILESQVAAETGDQKFFFVTRKGKLRRMELSDSQVKRLESGELAVVERPEPAQIEHSLVPAPTAEKILALSEKAVRFFNRPGSPIGFAEGPSDEEATASELPP
jgi:uncharacterized protein YaiL (DUF2058 family)